VVPALRAPGALQARGPPPALPRDLAGARAGADAQEDRPHRVQAWDPRVPRRRLGGVHDGAAGLGHPLVDGGRQLFRRPRGGARRREGRRARDRRALRGALTMPAALTVELIDRARATVPALLADAARRLPRLVYADMRLEVTESRHAIAENGAERSSGDDYACTAGVRVLAGDRAVAPGWIGIVLGAADVPALERRLAEALERAYRRAMANAEHKATAREKFGPLGDALADLRLHPVDVRLDVVPAVYRIDPRSVPLADMVTVATEVSRAIAAALPTSEREVVVVTDPHYNTLVSHEIVGHPAELDRALKMETAYAGRSWLLADLEAHQVGRRIASPLVTAYSDPALPGYGHYAYDHEGTPARRVTHIDRG